MPEKKSSYVEKVFDKPLRVKYKDVFEVKEFYTMLHEWCVQYGWNDASNSECIETYYGEKVSREGSKEIWIRWRTQKEAEGAKMTYFLDFDYHFLGVSSVEVVKDGIKMKVHKAELELNITPYISRDYEKELSKNEFLKPFINLFQKRVYRDVYEQRKKELYQETYILQNHIKQWFKLKRYNPYEEKRGWYPSYAWPSHLKE
jgi:hypothetical protein